MTAVRVPRATDGRRCSRDAPGEASPLVDEAGPLVDHARVPMRSSPLRRVPASAALAGALVAFSSVARADPPAAAGGPGVTAPPPAGAGWTRVHILTQSPKVTLERRVGSLPSDPPPPPRGPYSDGEPEWQRVEFFELDVVGAVDRDQAEEEEEIGRAHV